MIKIVISSILALTLPVMFLILVVLKLRNGKPLKRCGESCDCIDEKMLGCDASVV